MLEKIFDIEKFNIISDEDNYYFFRALNIVDNNDISNKTILSEFGKISKIRTDRERIIVKGYRFISSLFMGFKTKRT